MSETIVIENPGALIPRLIFLKGHLRLLSVGLKHSKMSGRQILDLVGAALNTRYKRGEYQRAIADINTRLDQEMPRKVGAA